MNYNTPDSDKQFNSNGLVPELPFLTQVPKVLKPYDNWVCWQYHQSGESLIRIPVTPQAKLESAYKLCQSEGYGLGFLLTPENPIAAICIAGYKDEHNHLLPDTEDILKISKTYTEIDDRVGELYVVGFADGEWNVGKDRIRIVSDEFVVPITVDTIGAFSNVSDCQQAFATVARRYCSLSWLEKFETMRESCDEFTALARVLTECLDTPNWLQDAESTDLYEFFYLFWWDEPRLKRKVEDQIDLDFRDFGSRSRAFKSLEAILNKMKSERKPPRSKSPRDNDDETEFDDDLPVIEFDREKIHDVVPQTMQALIAANAPLWQRDGQIVSVRHVPVKSSGGKKSSTDLRIIKAGESYIRKLATASAHHYTVTYNTKGRKTLKPDACHMDIIRSLVEEPQFDFDPLLAITTLPTLRPDGSIISTPGYDPDTWLYYQPSREYPEPKGNATIDDAIDALEILKEPFVNFDFIDECHRAATIASILGIMARHLVGNAPIVTITANARGTGKTLLFDVIALIATGKQNPKSVFPKKNEEMEKQLLAYALEGARVICYDNITTLLESQPLEEVLTSQFIKGRILSKNENAQVNMLSNFFATGNNMKYGGDMFRRALPIAITSDMERPEERTGLKHPDLYRWVRDHQPQLSMAALTILQAYILAGMPKQHISPFGSFQEWSDLVRSAVVWVGMDDPCHGRKRVEDESDTDRDRLRALINAWYTAYGTGVKKELRDVVSEVAMHYNWEQRAQTAPRKKDSRSGDDDAYALPTADQRFIDLGYALAAYDPQSKDRINDISHRRLSHKMPVDNGKSRPVSGKFLTFDYAPRSGNKQYGVEIKPEPAPAEATGEYDDEGLKYQPGMPQDDNLPF